METTPFFSLSSPTCTMALNALDELLESLDLSADDIIQLRNNTITLHKLITQHLASIAWTDEIERRAYARSEFRLSEESQSELDPTQALYNLRCEIADAVLAYNGGYVGREWEYAEVRAKIPKWITWPMLSKWVAKYDLERTREADKLAAAQAVSRGESAPASAPAPDGAWDMDHSIGSFAEEAMRAASAPGTWELERIYDYPELSEDAFPI